jgi:hypothetical protein
MIRWLTCWLTALLLAASPGWADFTYHFSPPYSQTGALDRGSEGLQGLHLNRDPSDFYWHGISWDFGGQFAWASGLDMTLNYSYGSQTGSTPPDLVLAYSSLLHADNLRLRADDARLALGPRIGHPVMPFQLEISAGTEARPLGGATIGVYGRQYGLYLYNRDPTTLRNSLVFQNLFGFYTDRSSTHTGDFALYNMQSQQPVFTVQPDNGYCVVAPKEGFFGARPTSQPRVTGSWRDGSAARNLLAALVKLGLVQDGTTP